MIKSVKFVLQKIKPKVFWGKNTPSLLASVREKLLDILWQIGNRYRYSFLAVKTNTEVHGIPQSRIRAFYFFWRLPTVPLLAWKMRP